MLGHRDGGKVQRKYRGNRMERRTKSRFYRKNIEKTYRINKKSNDIQKKED